MNARYQNVLTLLMPLLAIRYWFALTDERTSMTTNRAVLLQRCLWWALALALALSSIPGDLWAHHGESGMPGRNIGAVLLLTASPQSTV